EVIDRFGPVPQSVDELINSVRLRWMGEALGFEKLVLKNSKLKAYFVSENESYFNSPVFGSILSYIQAHPKKCKLRDTGGKAMMVAESIANVDMAIDLFSYMTDPKTSSKETLSK